MAIDSGMPAVELDNFGSIDILFLVDIIIKRESFKRRKSFFAWIDRDIELRFKIDGSSWH